jgi:hypothetical protein
MVRRLGLLVGLSGRRLATQAEDNEGHCFELFPNQPDSAEALRRRRGAEIANSRLCRKLLDRGKRALCRPVTS